jgi:S-adenosylmethionine synthetase
VLIPESKQKEPKMENNQVNNHAYTGRVRDHVLTSEAVSEGHPDKLADQISDAILDAALAQDSQSRVACEVLLGNNLCVIAGEITTGAELDYEQIARQTIVQAGYTGIDGGFNGSTCDVIIRVSEQSPEIAHGVKRLTKEDISELGAGDQGIVFGYATTETEEYLPLPYLLSRQLVKKLAEARKAGALHYLMADSKSQVSVKYRGDKPIGVVKVLISTQHLAQEHGGLPDTLEADLLHYVIRPALGPWYTEDIDIIINPAGPFTIGGPTADTGLTGRKIIVDTYGGGGRHGGGAFSGKDPTKVDRSGAYAARYVAKHVVASGAAARCEVQIAYVIGQANPFSIHVETLGTETVPVADIERAIKAVFDLRPAAIILDFDLTNQVYRALASYGHFGRPELNLPWEQLDKLDKFKRELNRYDANSAGAQHLRGEDIAGCKRCQSLIIPARSHPPFGSRRDKNGRSYIFAHDYAARDHGLAIEDYLQLVEEERLRLGHGASWLPEHGSNVDTDKNSRKVSDYNVGGEPALDVHENTSDSPSPPRNRGEDER